MQSKSSSSSPLSSSSSSSSPSSPRSTPEGSSSSVLVSALPPKDETWKIKLECESHSARHRLQVRLGEETRQVLVRSSQARSMDKKGRSIGRRDRDTKLGKDKPLGISRPLARGRFHRRGGGGRTRTRTRAGRQETSAVPVFSNFEAFHILTPDTIILIKLTRRSRKVESIRQRLGGKVTKLK